MISVKFCGRAPKSQRDFWFAINWNKAEKQETKIKNKKQKNFIAKICLIFIHAIFPIKLSNS